MSADTLKEVGDELVPELKDLQSKLMIAGGAGAAICAIGLFVNPTQFVRSLLPVYMWLLALALGSLALAMVHQVSGGAWGVVIRRILGAASRTLPLLTVLFVPIALGLHALQHRGQEAAGIVSFDGEHFHTERRLGLVGDHFTSRPVIDRLMGDMAIGHVRYSTCGDPVMRNVQPLFVDLESGGFALGHNGNLTNALTLRESFGGGGERTWLLGMRVGGQLVGIKMNGGFPDEAKKAVQGAWDLIVKPRAEEFRKAERYNPKDWQNAPEFQPLR